MIGRVFLAAVLTLAIPAAAVEVKDDTLILGLGAGVGSPQGTAGNSMGGAALLGGQLVYHPQGEWGLGLQVDRLDFKSKNGKKADMGSVMAIGRANIETQSDLYLPYLLGGMGWVQSRMDMPEGTDRGSGFGFCLGFGVERLLPLPRWTLGMELRYHNLSTPLPRSGLGTTSMMSLALRLDLWFEPEPDPFNKQSR